MSKQSSHGPKWESQRLYVLERDGWRCAYCGVHLEGTNATVDHIIPKAMGGTDIESNLIASCRTCNGRKTDKIYERVLWLSPIMNGWKP